MQNNERANTDVFPLTRNSNGNISLSMLDSDNQASAGYGTYNYNEPVGQISLDRVF